MQAAFQTARGGSSGPKCAPARDALDLLAQFSSTVSLERDQQIYGQGDEAASCYRVLQGCVRLVNLLEDGRRQVDEFLLPGDLFAFDVLGTHDFCAQAVTAVVLQRYPRRMVDALAEAWPLLSRRLRGIAAINLRKAHARLLLLGRKTASERMADFLLEMSERLARRGEWIELPMTRADVADHLGITIETVCRLLAHLRDDGAIEIGRGSIRITDGTALMQMACESQH